jgi:hypothetical protein
LRPRRDLPGRRPQGQTSGSALLICLLVVEDPEGLPLLCWQRVLTMREIKGTPKTPQALGEISNDI